MDCICFCGNCCRVGGTFRNFPNYTTNSFDFVTPKFSFHLGKYVHLRTVFVTRNVCYILNHSEF